MPGQSQQPAMRSAHDRIAASRDQSYREHSELLYSIHEVSRLISTHADKHMARVRVTHVQWWALMHIFENEGLTQSRLAEMMQMGRASLGRLVERLEAKHWIERRPDEQDARVRRIYLRHEVIPVFEHMTEEANALFEAFLAGISPAENRRLLAGLRKIRCNAEKTADRR